MRIAEQRDKHEIGFKKEKRNMISNKQTKGNEDDGRSRGAGRGA
jgi:hypothetical protein